MNYIIAKIGQKIIFNRSSKDCNRSNTNGNVGTYLLIKLLTDNNKNDNFYIISDNDIDDRIGNIIDASHMNLKEVNNINFKAMFILTGLSEFENESKIFDIINENKSKFIILSDDPRCLYSTLNDKRLLRFPDKIISQFEGSIKIKEKELKVNYEPLQVASCYMHKNFYNFNEKDKCFIIVANTSGSKYNRIKILSNLLKESYNIEIYGRLNNDEKKMLEGQNYIGEVNYNEMQNILRKTYFTLLIPIEKEWVTSKYIEALMNNVIPIFYSDYATNLLNCDDLIIIKNSNELRKMNLKYTYNMIKYINTNDTSIKSYIMMLKEKLVLPYIDGKILSNKIMKYIGE